MRVATSVGLTVVLGVLAAACGSDSKTASTTSTSASTTTEAALYQAAKAEGSLRIYTVTPEAQTDPSLADFKRRYPGISTSYIRLSTNEMSQRLSSEYASGTYEADILETPDSNYVHDAIAKGILLAPKRSGLPDGFPPAGLPAEYVLKGGELASASLSPFGIGYNSKLLDKADVPTSFEDFADPKWKGKIVSISPVEGGLALWNFFDFLGTTYGDGFLRAFAANQPKYLLPLPGAQALAAGQFEVSVPAFASLQGSLKNAGAPYELVVPDETSGSGFFFAVAAKAKHPNAAKLYMNYIYSRGGADTFAGIPGQVSPYGGGDSKTPSKFVPTDDARATSPERQAELRKLLGL